MDGNIKNPPKSNKDLGHDLNRNSIIKHLVSASRKRHGGISRFNAIDATCPMEDHQIVTSTSGKPAQGTSPTLFSDEMHDSDGERG